MCVCVAGVLSTESEIENINCSGDLVLLRVAMPKRRRRRAEAKVEVKK
jgi:hypothetical protein